MEVSCTQERCKAVKARGNVGFAGCRAFLPVWLVSICFLSLTPIVTSVPVLSQEDLCNLFFGWPFPFIQQDQRTRTPPASWFPNRVRILNPKENPTCVLWGGLLGSMMLVGAVCVPVSLGVQYLIGPLFRLRSESKHLGFQRRRQD